MSKSVLAGLLLVLLLAASCTGNTADTVNVDLGNLQLQAVLPPGYPATVQGSTLEVQGFQGTPVVHSYPMFAGVDNAGDLGIGSAIGYVVGNSFYLPINANLGGGQMLSYKICLTIDAPEAVRLLGISGSNQYLSQTYPDQYARAQGFEKIPQKSDSPFCIWDISSGAAATGRVNLAELQFSILQSLPAAGVHLNLELKELKDALGNDLCPALSPSGCAVKNGIIIHNFSINN